MSAIALNERGFKPMSDGGDVLFPTVQIVVTVAIAAVSGAIGFFVRNLGRARDDGLALGEIRAWIAEAKLQARDMEQRLGMRIASLELHRDNTATKQDLKDAVADIKEQLRDVVSEVRGAGSARPAGR